MPPSSNTVRIYILAGDISYNKGDRGNLLAQIGLIRERFPTADITLCSLRPEKDQQWYNARVIPRSFFPNLTQLRYLRKADIIVWGGGAPVTDHGCRLLIPYWMITLFIAKFVFHKRILAWSHGVVLQTRLGRFLARILYGKVECICVRDRGSFERVRALHVSTPLLETADAAVTLRYDREPTDVTRKLLASLDRTRPLIGIHPTFWHLYNSPQNIFPYLFRRKHGFFSYEDSELLEKFTSGLTTLSDALMEKYDCSILLFPRYADPLWDDVQHLRNVRDASRTPERITVLEEDIYGPGQYPLIIAQLNFVVAIALHDAIFATVTETPFIHLSYESKGSDYMHALGAEQRLAPWESLLDDGGRRNVLQMIQRTMNKWPEMLTEQRTNLEALKIKARRNEQILHSMLTSCKHIDHTFITTLR